MKGPSELAHLVRRFAGSLSRRAPAPEDERWAESHLLAGEVALWWKLSNVDRRHAIHVARRFQAVRPDAGRDELAGALLHDVGKIESGLGTAGRVVATVVGPRTRRFRTYHDHEELGAVLAGRAGSTAVTVELIRRHGPAAAALDRADHV